MPSRKLLKRIGLVALTAIVLLAVSALVVSNRYPTEQTARLQFTLDDNFTEVRSILVRTGATKQIIIMAGDNEFIKEEWKSVGAGLDSLNIFDPAWRVEFNGTLTVRSRDEYVGTPVVKLEQNVKINPNEVLSKVDLLEGSQRLRDYQMVTRFVRNQEEKNTTVELELTQEIVTTAPWFAHWVADRRVRASAQRALANQQRAIEKLIADNRGKTALLPLFR